MAIESLLVIPRKLPCHGGTALVLSKRGADWLLDLGIDAKSGKNWGESENGEWRVPCWWRHDLLAAGVLSLLVAQGFSVIPERQIRRENPGVQKYPDGLIYRESEWGVESWWLEVESTRKTGKPMMWMAASLVNVAMGTCPMLSGIEPHRALVAMSRDARDQRGYRLDHVTRVKNAVYKQLGDETIEIDFLYLQKKGAGIAGFEHEVVTFSPDQPHLSIA